MKLVSEHVVVIREVTWNYEYNTVEEFQAHKEEMKQTGALLELSHKCRSGKIIAAYIKREEQEVK